MLLFVELGNYSSKNFGVAGRGRRAARALQHEPGRARGGAGAARQSAHASQRVRGESSRPGPWVTHGSLIHDAEYLKHMSCLHPRWNKCLSMSVFILYHLQDAWIARSPDSPRVSASSRRRSQVPLPPLGQHARRLRQGWLRRGVRAVRISGLSRVCLACANLN